MLFPVRLLSTYKDDLEKIYEINVTITETEMCQNIRNRFNDYVNQKFLMIH